MNNPFRPTAGATPPDIVGRAGLLDGFKYGLRVGAGAPSLLTIFTGARGIGKTVMLNSAEQLATERGWIVISETATPGFVARIGESMRGHIDELGDKSPTRRVTGLSVAGFGISTQLTPENQVSWRQLGTGLLGKLSEQVTGLIVSVDEIHAADRIEISQLAANVQHFIRERLPIGVLFAGLPAAVSDLLNEGVATILRRAERIDLHAATIAEVSRSFKATFDMGGMMLEPRLALQAATASGGYPFLIQLVGYALWQLSETADAITDDLVRLATAEGLRRHKRMVVEAAVATTSPRDREFLKAMSIDLEQSQTVDIGARLGLRPNAVGNYRRRLIDSGLIEPAGHGKIRFALPGLAEFFRGETD